MYNNRTLKFLILFFRQRTNHVSIIEKYPKFIKKHLNLIIL